MEGLEEEEVGEHGNRHVPGISTVVLPSTAAGGVSRTFLACGAHCKFFDNPDKTRSTATTKNLKKRSQQKHDPLRRLKFHITCRVIGPPVSGEILTY